MRALVLSVNAVDAEVASDELWSLGVVAIEERSGAREGTIELWTSLGEETDSITASVGALAHRWDFRFETVDEGVSETWRAHAAPTWISDDLVIYPAWAERPEGAADAGRLTAIAIEPGATFGMGDHPTTVLSLRSLAAVVTAGARVLDVGCGSGVLAIAACRLGASQAVAIDISPAAVPTTIHNAELNAVSEQIAVSTSSLAEVDDVFDVVVANILAPALIDLAADLKRVLSPHGALVISGILAERHDHVLDALRPLRVVHRADLDGWTAITLRW